MKTSNSESFKFKAKITGRTAADGNRKDVEIIVPLKYFSNLRRNLVIPLINWEISLQHLQQGAKLYGPVEILSTQGNTKPLKQLKSGFTRTINRKKYQNLTLFRMGIYIKKYRYRLHFGT